MAYLSARSGYLVIGGPVARKQIHFQLWFWSGQRAAPARRVTIAGLQGFEHAEGVCPAVINGQQKIVIVSDDGDRKEGRYGHFLLVDVEELQIGS
jgi:hypothetical protein